MHKIEPPKSGGAAPTYRGCALIRLYTHRGKPDGWSTIVRVPTMRVLNASSQKKLIAAIDAHMDAGSATKGAM